MNFPLNVSADYLIDAELDCGGKECLYQVWLESEDRFKLYIRASSKRMAFLKFDKKFKECGVRYNSSRERIFIKLVGVPVSKEDFQAKQAWDKKFITAEEIAVIVPIPEAVLDDSEYDIWGEVKPRVTEAFGKVIDSAVLFGENKPNTWREDVVTTATKAGAVVTLGAADSLYDKIMAEDGVIAHIEDCGYFVNGHMADISMRAKLRGLKNANGDPLFKQDLQGSTQYALDGSPMNFPNNGAFDKSKALMISGDFSQLVYSIRQDITFKLFTEGVVQNTDGTIAYNLMQNDMVALRAVMRLGWEIPNPINALKTDKTKRCPFAILKAGE